MGTVAWGANAQKALFRAKLLKLRGLLVRPDRFELPTFWFVARRSIQLSYGRTLQQLQTLRQKVRVWRWEERCNFR